MKYILLSHSTLITLYSKNSHSASCILYLTSSTILQKLQCHARQVHAVFTYSRTMYGQKAVVTGKWLPCATRMPVPVGDIPCANISSEILSTHPLTLKGRFVCVCVWLELEEALAFLTPYKTDQVVLSCEFDQWTLQLFLLWLCGLWWIPVQQCIFTNRKGVGAVEDLIL